MSAPKSSPDRTQIGAQDLGELDIELKPESTFAAVASPNHERPAPPSSKSQAAQDWQGKLAERVEEYRRRRARLHDAKPDGSNTLNLDFGLSQPQQPEPRPKVIEFPSSEELEHSPKPAPSARSAPQGTGLGNFESAFQPGKTQVKPPPTPKAPPSPETAPLEIEFGSSQGKIAAGIRASASSNVPGAIMSARFFAGIIDALVLLSGATVYSLIFWRTGGEFSLQPLELAAAAVVCVFFILLYFAGCTVLASATPGLMWAGLEVTTFEGNPPTASESLWRGFGYLVSISALMLGFIWAAVDADGLTWHDRMSRTFIIPANHQ